MKVFEIVNNYPIITAECLMIPEFKNIWDRDKNKNKENAKNEIAYVWFILDFKSPYLAYSESEREKTLIKDLFKKDKYKPDDLVLAAMNKYQELMETPVTRMLRSSLNVVNKLSDFLDNVDLNERTKNGSVVFKANEIKNTVSDLDKVATSIKSLMEKAYSEEESFEKNRGGVTGGELEFDRF